MKLFCLTLSFIFLVSFKSLSQTTLTADANGVLNVTKLVAQTSVGQTFFTAHQVGSGYYTSAPIFQAITDNASGSNYFYNGLSGTTTTFSIRSDGQGYFATNVGVGVTIPQAQLHVFGVNQSTAALSTSSSFGGCLYLQDSGTSAGNGGSVIFGIGQGAFAAIKGLGTNGYSNTQGDLAFSTRAISTNTTLTERMRILANGAVGIGTSAPGSYLLSVNGDIHAKQVNIDLTGWPDYVFKSDYKLTALSSVQAYIDANHHLPDVPTEQDIKQNGLNLGEMNKILVKKIEELTLYLLEQNKRIEKLESELKNKQ